MAGFFVNGMDELTTAMTGDERIPCDTGLSSGANPASASLSPTQVASGAMTVSIPLTGFTITIADGITAYVINPAGTLATGTFTLPANPTEGQLLEISSTQTQTAVTISANTGHTIVGAAATALTAVTAIRFRFLATKWYRVA